MAGSAVTDDLFRYVPQIEQILEPGQTIDAVLIQRLSERDRQLEDYLANCPCGGEGSLVVGGAGTGLPILSGAAAASSGTTSAFTPGASGIVFAFVASGDNRNEVPSISDSAGGTWTLIKSEMLDGGGEACALWAKPSGSSPVSQTVTFTFTGSSAVIQWIIMEVPGATAVVQSASAWGLASGAAITASLASAFEKSTNLAVGFAAGWDGGGAWSVGSGFTSLGADTQAYSAGDAHTLLESKENDSSIDATYAFTDVYKAIIGVEVRR